MLDCLNKINYELKQAIDKHSKAMIANNIELLLNYCNGESKGENI
jgi:AraC family transcriptional regulator, transcriptional activator of pobA